MFNNAQTIVIKSLLCFNRDIAASNSPRLSVASSLPRLWFSCHRGEFAPTTFGKDEVLPRASGPIVLTINV